MADNLAGWTMPAEKQQAKDDISEAEAFLLSASMTKEALDNILASMEEKLGRLARRKRDDVLDFKSFTEDVILAHFDLYVHDEIERANGVYSGWKAYMERKKKGDPEIAEIIDKLGNFFIKRISGLAEEDPELVA